MINGNIYKIQAMTKNTYSQSIPNYIFIEYAWVAKNVLNIISQKQ